MLITLLLLSPAAAAASTSLSGTWRSASEAMPLTTAFDESVWGKNAKSIRTVQMVIEPTGEATLTIVRKVVDARGRMVRGTTSLEHVEVVLGAAETVNGIRSELPATVKNAERRYPDDPEATWILEDLRVTLATFNEKPDEIEVRVDFPAGRGSFWEMLRRIPRSIQRRATRAHNAGADLTVHRES